MWRAQRADRLASGLALVAGAGAILALLGSGGCEALVSDTIPSFECLPGAANCPGGSVCVPTTHRCVERTATCLAIVCPAGQLCDSQTLQCAEGPADDASSRGRRDVGSPGRRGARGAGQPGRRPDLHRLDRRRRRRRQPGRCSAGRRLELPRDHLQLQPPVRLRQRHLRGPGHRDLAPLHGRRRASARSRAARRPIAPPSMVCFGTGGGGDYCVTPAWIGRGTTVGSGEGGAACEGDGDCRSGLCVDQTSAPTRAAR